VAYSEEHRASGLALCDVLCERVALEMRRRDCTNAGSALRNAPARCTAMNIYFSVLEWRGRALGRSNELAAVVELIQAQNKASEVPPRKSRRRFLDEWELFLSGSLNWRRRVEASKADGLWCRLSYPARRLAGFNFFTKIESQLLGYHWVEIERRVTRVL
jgi:hypothetical protein